jgi:hypothetical protein
MLSCNSTRASICGLALSWKYNPQALGASHTTEGNTNVTIVPTKNDKNTNFPLLCKGKLVKA